MIDYEQFKGHTKGDWHWKLNEECKQVYLVGKNSWTVMDFVRYGMRGAAPRFIGKDGLLYRAEHWGVKIAGREHHVKWCKELNHPDAKLIEKAPELLKEHIELRNQRNKLAKVLKELVRLGVIYVETEDYPDWVDWAEEEKFEDVQCTSVK